MYLSIFLIIFKKILKCLEHFKSWLTIVFVRVSDKNYLNKLTDSKKLTLLNKKWHFECYFSQKNVQIFLNRRVLGIRQNTVSTKCRSERAIKCRSRINYEDLLHQLYARNRHVCNRTECWRRKIQVVLFYRSAIGFCILRIIWPILTTV